MLRNWLTVAFSITVICFFFPRLDAVKPIQYLENKSALNKALERSNWPISLEELSLLENEILAGKMYIHQAMELQEASKRNCMSQAPAEVGGSSSLPVLSHCHLYTALLSLSSSTTLISDGYGGSQDFLKSTQKRRLILICS